MAHPWATELDYNKAKGDAYLVGEKSGCRNMKTDQELVTCLRGKDAQRITLAVDLVIVFVVSPQYDIIATTEHGVNL